MTLGVVLLNLGQVVLEVAKPDLLSSKLLYFFPWSVLNFANSSTGFRLTARQQDNSERMQRLLMVRVERILNGVYDGIN